MTSPSRLGGVRGESCTPYTDWGCGFTVRDSMWETGEQETEE